MMMNNTSYIMQGNSLESPMTQKYGESFTSSTGLECGASGMQGWRVEMEDAHIAVDIPSKPNHLFLGVWDGHAGDGAAKYAANNLERTAVDEGVEAVPGEWRGECRFAQPGFDRGFS